MPLTQKSCVLTIHDCRWDVRDPLLDRLANTHLEKERERERESVRRILHAEEQQRTRCDGKR